MGSILNDADRNSNPDQTPIVVSIIHWPVGKDGRDEHAAPSSPVGAYDRWRVVGSFGEQTSIPNVSSEAPHSLRVPFPKGAPTAPELKPVDTTAFEEERAALLELVERIGTGEREGMGPVHPLFGPLTWREWGAVTYKHADHHLKQFGA